jgi:outer membrane protein OmpA-like peptidoglycan-associated protein
MIFVPLAQAPPTWNHMVVKSLLVLALLAAQVSARVVVVDSSVEILDSIHFVGTTAQMTPSASRMLDAVAATLDGNPSIKKIEVIAFGNDLRRPIGDQLGLGERRAKAIVDELVRRGVAPTRLQWSTSIHPSNPADPHPEFLIIKRG